jgi:DNA-binding IclR family transcriptional regulator
VLDKAVSVLAAVGDRPRSLSELVAATGISRPTAHRLAVSLETHRFLRRDAAGRFTIGPRSAELARSASDPLLLGAEPVLTWLRDSTGESAQLYRLEGAGRRCVAAVERASGLRDTVAVGSVLPLRAGSAAQVLLAFTHTEPPADAAFSARTLSDVRRRGWAASVGEREPGVASVSAPVRDADGQVLAAISISGPVERLGRSPGKHFAAAVTEAADRLAHTL